MLATSQPLPTPALSVRWPEGGPAPHDVTPSRQQGDSGGPRPPLKKKTAKGATPVRMRAKQRSNLTNVSKTVTSRRPRAQGQEDDVSTAPKASASSKRAPSPGRAEQAPGYGGSGEGGMEDEERSEAGSCLSSAPDPDTTLQPGSDEPARLSGEHLQSEETRQELQQRLLSLSGGEDPHQCHCQAVLDVGLSPWHPPTSPSCHPEPPRALKKSRKKEQTNLSKAHSMQELNGEGDGRWRFRHLEDPQAYITEYRRLLCVGGVGKAVAPAQIKLGVHVPDPYVSRLKMLWPGFLDDGEDFEWEPECLTSFRLSMNHRDKKELSKGKVATTEAELQRLARLQGDQSKSQEPDTDLDPKARQLNKCHVTTQPSSSFARNGDVPGVFARRQQHGGRDSIEDKAQRSLIREATRPGWEKTSMPTLHIATLVDPQALSDSLNRYLSLQQQQQQQQQAQWQKQQQQLQQQLQQQTRLPLLPQGQAHVVTCQSSSLALGPCPYSGDGSSVSSRLPPVPRSPTPKATLTSSLPATVRVTSEQPLASEGRESSGKSRVSQLTLDGKTLDSRINSLRRSSFSSSTSSSSASSSISTNLTLYKKTRSNKNSRLRTDSESRSSAPVTSKAYTPLSVSLIPVARERKASLPGRKGITPEVERECSHLTMSHPHGSMPNLGIFSHERRPTVIDVNFTATSALDPDGSRARADRGHADRYLKRTAYRF